MASLEPHRTHTHTTAVKYFGLNGGGVAILVRFDSQRLPFKAWRRIEGYPLLEYLLRRLETLPLPVMVMTTQRAIDRPLALLAKRTGYQCINSYTGSSSDVLGRLLHGVEKMGWRYVIRISGDSPVMHADTITDIIQQWQHQCDKSVDIFTSVWPKRITPSGLSVEIIKLEALKALAKRINCPQQREHVTLGFYQNPEDYVIKSLKKNPYSHIQTQALVPHRVQKLSVDTIADYQRVKNLLRNLKQ